MERRGYRRINTCLPVKYFCDDRQYSGTITNFSETGMFISTGNFFPCVNSLEIHVPLQSEIATLQARIRRVEKINDSTYNIGIELLDPAENYRNYVGEQGGVVRTERL